MARQQAAQRPIGTRKVGGDSGAAGVIRFEPELAVQAIVFHLAEEGISSDVVVESADATVGRLRRSTVRPTVARAIWSEMTNPQRLEWLLQQTGTIARLVSDEKSILEPSPR
jgi:hypothetical protein